jgi:internalin A
MSELALRRIAQNKRTRARFLYLGGCALSEVPAEVGELQWLESLSLADGYSHWSGHRWHHKHAEPPEVANTQLRDLSSLAGLTNLRDLTVCDTRVSDLAPLADLTTLQTLNVGGNTQIRDVTPLAGLTGLQELILYYTQVTDLRPLSALSKLQILHLGGTPITDLTPLSSLPALQRLDLRNTFTSDLSPLLDHIRRGLTVKQEFSLSEGIYVAGAPLAVPPPEIVRQGSEAMLNYFAERAVGDVDHLYEAKLLILGDGEAGKTSLLRRLYQPDQPLPRVNETTKGIGIYRHQFKLRNGQTFRLNVWDFGGQEIYRATHQFFLTRRSLYVLVDDTGKDHKTALDKGFKEWLDLIDVLGGHSPTLIFQNEKGDRTKQIDFVGIKQRYDNVKELYGGNLERSETADKLREGIEFFASRLDHIGEELPAHWIKVRAAIEARANQNPYIPVQEYFEIYSRHMEFDRSKALHLSRYLHDLGVFLHFQDDALLSRTVILQNDWATEAAFRILDDTKIKERRGRFSYEDCGRLWKDSKYADMHPELLALMKRFELCYEMRDSQPPKWLAPQLLSPSRPEQLANWGKPGDLVLRYRYDFLPRGMTSRLMVRLNRFVSDPEMAWDTGVLFERGNTAVLVEILGGSDIELRARGPERKELLTVIAADLDALNDSFPGLPDKVDKRIPCNCDACRTAPVPEFFNQKDLLRRRELGILKVQCNRLYKDVDVLELLDGIKVDDLPGWANDYSATRAEASPTPAPRTVRIFLASSSELLEDRDAFDLYFRQQTDLLRKKGIYLEIVRWEKFLDAISSTGLQDEYNRKVRQCDIFVSLFCTKTGKFSEEEFDTAHSHFKETGKPLIYTFFRKAVVDLDTLPLEDYMSLRTFKTKLKELGHHAPSYNDIEHLKRQFGDQLDMLLDQGALG